MRSPARGRRSGMTGELFANYCLSALRHAARTRMITALSLTGLSVALACVFLCLLVIRYEVSFDTHWRDADRLHRVTVAVALPDRPPRYLAQTMGPLAERLAERFPGTIEAAGRIDTVDGALAVGDRKGYESLSFVDTSITRIFSFTPLEGRLQGALSRPDAIVLTRSIKERYFGPAPALGKTIRVEGRHDHVVTAVVEDPPQTTHLVIEAMIPLTSPTNQRGAASYGDWFSLFVHSYVKLAPDARPEALDAAMAEMIDAEIPMQRDTGPASNVFALSLQPVRAIHLDGRFEGGMRAGGGRETVEGLGAVAALILILAVVNFVSLATAQGLTRRREIALRRTLGASRREILVQFLCEAWLIGTLCFVLALALAEIATPFLRTLTEAPLLVTYGESVWLLLGFYALSVITAFLAAAWPAYMLTRDDPSRGGIASGTRRQGGLGQAARQGAEVAGRTGTFARQVAITAQFAASIVLIALTLIVLAQTNYAKNMALGYEREDVVVLSNPAPTSAGPGERRSLLQRLAAEMRRTPGVVSVCASSSVPTDFSESSTSFSVPGRVATPGEVVGYVSVDAAFFETYRIPLVAGRSFADVPTADFPERRVRSAVLNASAVRKMGFGTPSAAIGRVFEAGTFTGERAQFEVIGVVADLQLRSARDPIRPLFFHVDAREHNFLSLRIDPRRRAEAMAQIEAAWSRVAPLRPLARSFVAERYAAMYQADERRAGVFAAFAGLALFLAATGLFGLAAVNARRRTKEIGLRKAMGAESGDIVRLFLWRFTVPVLIANAIAWPTAYVLAQAWLSGFAYRIAPSPAFFLGAGALALVIAWCTVGLHAWRVARTNPADALREE